VVAADDAPASSSGAVVVTAGVVLDVEVIVELINRAVLVVESVTPLPTNTIASGDVTGASGSSTTTVIVSSVESHKSVSVHTITV